MGRTWANSECSHLGEVVHKEGRVREIAIVREGAGAVRAVR